MVTPNWACRMIVTVRVCKHNPVRWLVLGPDRAGSLLLP